MRSTFTSAGRAALPIVALLVAVSSHASYTVIDDDLLPSSYMSEVRDRALAEVNSDKFKITFAKGSSSLNPMARSFLDEMLPRMRNAAQIRIVGRMDKASANENKKSRQLGTARASSIRTYLVRQGISLSVLEVAVEDDGNPDAANGYSSSDVLVSNPAPVRAPTQTHSIPRQYKYLNSGSQAAPAQVQYAVNTQPAPVPSANDDAMLQYINHAVQAGQMQPSVAAQIIRSMLEAKGAAVVVANTPAPAMIAAAPAAIPTTYIPQERAPVRIERWTLDARKNLKDNFDAWAAASGWKPTVWNASNFYQVTNNAVLDGAFPDILKRIADSTGLNICAYAREKYVRVTDPDVPCKTGAERAY